MGHFLLLTYAGSCQMPGNGVVWTGENACAYLFTMPLVTILYPFDYI